MQILKNEREFRFSLVASFARLTDGACGRIEKEGPVVRLTVVVTRNPESQRESQNQNRRGKRPPTMMGINERGIKRREVRPPLVVFSFKGARSRIGSKTPEQNNDGQ